ncbi:MAG: aspartate-semialdehyde dehydrogenase [Candidatus Methylomirabilales bacterium]|nr:aspartate-semialdehyde dehydrogenase [candidate division NC10 bacterium]
MAGTGYRVAIAGATGAVGQTMLSILEERDFPVRSLRLLASERSEGKVLTFRGEEVKIERLTERAFQGVELALFSAGASRSQAFAPAGVRAGALVVDNSSAFRMDPEVPLVIPEVNPEAAFQHKGLIANPNCTTTVTVMALKPLHDAAKVKRVIASSYQAVSGAGTQAIEELKQQVLAWAKGEQAEARVFPHPIAFNLIPQVDVFEQSGYSREEMKLVHETRKLLGDMTIKITATTVRVPVWYAHSVSVTAETERKVTVGEARDLFTKFPGLHLCDDPPKGQYPTPLMVVGKDECYVGRVREDLSSETGLNFWVVGDQLRKGAALNAIQIAELILGVTKQGDGSCTTSS